MHVWGDALVRMFGIWTADHRQTDSGAHGRYEEQVASAVPPAAIGSHVFCIIHALSAAGQCYCSCPHMTGLHLSPSRSPPCWRSSLQRDREGDSDTREHRRYGRTGGVFRRPLQPG